jgi:hypothetical protein
MVLAPQNFLCPIKHEVMRVPTITPKGQTYEYEAILHWVTMHGQEPQTKALPASIRMFGGTSRTAFHSGDGWL